MAYRPLEVTVISAKDLSNVNLFSKMEVYAVAEVDGDPRMRKKTPVDREGGRNPSWGTAVKFTVQEYDLPRAALRVTLKASRALGDRVVGEVCVPIRELFDAWAQAAPPAKDGGQKPEPLAQFVSYQVRRPSGRAKGVLYLSYKFGELVPVPITTQVHKEATAYPAAGHTPAYPPPTKASSEPVTAYPAGPSTGAYPYPSTQPGYAYPPPPQQGYAYPPPPQGGYPGYGYPPPPQQGGYGYGGPVVPPQQQGGRRMGGGMGAGLGMGLLGGMLGGMILGDAMSDVAAYDAGYDAGFDDGFGF